MRKKTEGEQYIEAFPEFKKWINECIICHFKGYDPKMPQEIGKENGNLGSYFIRKYFEPLEVDSNGMCLICAKIVKIKEL